MIRRAHENDQHLRTLTASAAFCACQSDDLRDLLSAGRVTTLPDGWPMLQEGTPADACYVLLSGRARVVAGGRALAELGPGDVVGETALLDRRLRSASVITETRITALRVGNDDMEKIMRRCPGLRAALEALRDSRLPA